MYAVALTDTITLGSLLVGALVSVSIVISVIYGAKWKTVATVEAANASAWEDTAKRFEEQVQHLNRKVEALQKRINELEALPDVNAVLARLNGHDEATRKAMQEHDEHAEQRTSRVITAIEQVRDAVQN